MILKEIALWLIASVTLVACGSSKIHSHVTTDLGAAGNQTVFRTYKDYLSKPTSGCISTPMAGSHRVLLTGFGLFEGASYNISGVVIQSMANSAFWPPVAHDSAIRPSDGRLSESDHGGRAEIRAIHINGVPFEICLLSLDVKWDLAGTIITHEMQQFRPELVIMTGRGAAADTAVLEGGAINNATKLNGYSPSGDHLSEANRPVADGGPIVSISSNTPIPNILPMTWDNRTLASAASAPLSGANYGVYAESEARSNNDYICNNVSYIALYAAQGHKFNLAGSTLDIEIAGGLPNTKIGFLHLPYKASNDPDSVNAIINGIVAMIAKSAL